jgi:hypothetical protein
MFARKSGHLSRRDILRTAGSGFASGPEGMKKRIDDEVPKWRDIVAKAGIKPV